MESLNENNIKVWEDFTNKQEAISPQYLIVWKDFISKTYKNCEPYYYLEKENVKTIFPFFLIKSKLFGNRLISQPFLDFGGPQGKFNEKFTLNVIENLKGKFSENVKHIEIRLNNFSSEYEKVENLLLGIGFIKESKKNQFILKLEDEKVLWGKFDRITRKGIKKANKSNLKIKEMNNEKEFKTFYNLYLRNMKNFGAPQHSYDFFLNLLKDMKKNFKGLNCYKEGKLIGTLIVFYSKNYMYAAFNFSDPKYLRYQPNDLLYWEMIKWAIKNKIKYFDFGQCDSKAEEGTHAFGIYRFKKKWGGNLYEKNYFYYEFDCAIGDKTKKESKNKKLIKIWSKLPLPLIKKIGPKIASQLAL